MTAALVLILAAALLGLRRACGAPATAQGAPATPARGRPAVARAGERLAGRRRAPGPLRERLARAGLAERVSARALLAAKIGGALAGLALGCGRGAGGTRRASRWIVAIALPAGGFLGPDAWLERRARGGSGRSVPVCRTPSTCSRWEPPPAAARSPGLSELGRGEGPLARELAMLSAESSCGASAERGARVAAAAGAGSGGLGDVRR